MRRYTIYAAAISAAAVSIYGLSSAATAKSPAAARAVAHSSTAVRGTPTTFPDAKCGTSEGTWTADGFSAQNGGATNPSLVTWGAKHIKCHKRMHVTQIVLDGYPNQSININFNIEVYRNTKAFNTARYTSDPQPNDARAALCSYTDEAGTFAAAGVTGAQWTINLSSPCNVGATTAKRGIWFAVQADLDQSNGQWFWATQTTADHPNEADWVDAQNLFGDGCLSFATPPAGGDVGANKDAQDCIFAADAGEKDFIMVLN
jgi:hypothetical protein